MATSTLPVNVDTTYADATDPAVKVHQQHHDIIHGVVNQIDPVYHLVPIVCRTAAQGVPTAAQCAAAGYPDGTLITVDPA